MTVDVVIAIVVDAGKILISRRKPDDHLGGFWEFPGGTLESDESLEQCLHRELMEEIGVRTSLARRLPSIEHQYPGKTVRLHPFICRGCTGEPRPLEVDEVRWIAPHELHDFPFPPANAELLKELSTLLSGAKVDLPDAMT